VAERKPAYNDLEDKNYNCYPAKIFMGDSGSLFIGFLLSGITIITCQKTVLASPFIIATIVLVIPLIDTVWAVIRRLRKHQGLFHADKEHIHHSFLKAGFSQKTTTLILCSFTLTLGGISILLLSLKTLWAIFPVSFFLTGCFWQYFKSLLKNV